MRGDIAVDERSGLICAALRIQPFGQNGIAAQQPVGEVMPQQQALLGREPDLDTLVRIAVGLGTTPNWLLGLDAEGRKPTKRAAQLDRLLASARQLTDEELRVLIVGAEALVREKR